MKMLVNGAVFILMLIFSNGLYAHDLRTSLSSFFGLDRETFQNAPLHQFRERIFSIAETTNNSTRNIFENSNFSNVTAKDIQFLHPVLFSFITVEKLGDISGRELAYLFNNFNENINLITKILEAIKNNEQRVDFLTQLTDDGLNATVLRTIAENILATSTSTENRLDLLLYHRGLLLSAPPSFLLMLPNVYKIFITFYEHYMATMMDMEELWIQQSQLVKRTWSRIVFGPNKTFQGMKRAEHFYDFRFVLESVTVAELKEILDSYNYKEFSSLKSVNWTTIQLREIIKLLNNNDLLNETLPDNFLSHLSPKEMELVRAEILRRMLNSNLSFIDDPSLPVAIQYFEYFMAINQPIAEFISHLNEDNCEMVGKLLYSQSNSFLSSTFYNEKIPMNLIKRLDSEKYSLVQAHYILGEIDISDPLDNLLNLNHLIAGIPASFFLNFDERFRSREISIADYLIHMFEFSPGGNIMRAMAVLQQYKTLGKQDYIEKVIENPDNEFISLISPVEISSKASEILKFLQMKVQDDEKFKNRIANLPPYVLTELLRPEGDLMYENLFNDSHPLHLVVLGLNCEILSKVPVSDFLPIFEFYNKQRELNNKEFPKNLQRCSREKFLSYLRIKSILANEKIDDDVVRYLDLADIRTIKGYVLADFSPEFILRSKHRDEVIREIGRISFPELMLAAPKNHLTDLLDKYLTKKISEGFIYLEDLLQLRNLIHFLSETFLSKIHPPALKFVIEAGVIDTRICASAKKRNIWETLLNQAFGSPAVWEEDTVIMLNDMLITIADSALNNISFSNVDLVKSRYTEDIEWIPFKLPFYEVCSNIIPSNEKENYASSIKKLALFYAYSIEKQWDTIARAENISKSESFKIFTRRFSEEPNTSMFSDVYENVENHTRTAPFLTTKSTNFTEILNNGKREADESDNSEIIDKFTSLKTTVPIEFTENIYASTASLSKFNVGDQTVSGFDTRSSQISVSDATEKVTGITQSSILLKKGFEETNSENNLSSSKITLVIETTSSKTSWDDDIVFSTINGQEEKYFENSSIPSIAKNIQSISTLQANLSQITTIEQKLYENSHSTLNATSVTSSESFRNSRLEPVSEETITVSLSPSSPSTQYISKYVDNSTVTSVFSVDAPVTERPMDSLSTSFSNNSKDEIDNISKNWNDLVKNYTSASETSTTFYSHNLTSEFIGEKTNTEPGTPYSLTEITEPTKSSTTTDEMLMNQIKKDVPKMIREVLLQSNVKNKTLDSSLRRKREAEMPSEIKSRNFSCNTLKILDSMSSFIVSSIYMTEDEIFNCVELLGRMHLSDENKTDIWSKIKPKLSDSNLYFVAQKILSVLSEKDYENFDLNVQSKWTLELIHAISQNLPSHIQNNGSNDLTNLANIILRNNELFSSQENFSPAVTVAFGKIICNFPFNTISKILGTNDSFSNIWVIFHGIDGCPMDCLSTIAKLAVNKLGHPSQWNPAVFTMLGPVAAGVPGIHENSSLIPYLHLSAIECLYSKINVTSMSEDVIMKMSQKSIWMLRGQNNQSFFSNFTSESSFDVYQQSNLASSKENILKSFKFLFVLLSIRFLL